jgi:hypothetical protein
MTTNLDEQPGHPVPAATPQTPSPNDQNMLSGVDAEQTAQYTAKAAEHPIPPSTVENPCDSDILSTKSQDDIGGDAILDDPDSPSNSASRKVRESTAELFARHPTPIANPVTNRQSPTPASTENRGLTSNPSTILESGPSPHSSDGAPAVTSPVDTLAIASTNQDVEMGGLGTGMVVDPPTDTSPPVLGNPVVDTHMTTTADDGEVVLPAGGTVMHAEPRNLSIPPRLSKTSPE